MTAPTPAPEYGELIERLEAGEHVLAWSGGAVQEPETDVFVLMNPDGPEAARAIRDLEAENARLADKVEGLDADLRSAVQVAWKRGAVRWARMNYPGWVEWLEACDEADLKREDPS